MPRGSRSRSCRAASPASRAPQMRASLRQGPAAQPLAAAVPRQQVLMAQMTPTVAGVSVGSVLGHSPGHAITGGFSGGGDAEPAKSDITYQEPRGPAAGPAVSWPCSLEIEQFMECAQNQSDVKLFEGFNEVLWQCRIANGII
ncbi:coiled-coil-helix-coiled-coil-helix domain-containing protein 2-like [Phodopus roborovskii]|uniref:coiled-coil-helix-coiled-coil-helix domain-containing protein 2-like n=1 Tax=Phodopus roborovskii TaxID=109678 RepID=UPI0021E3C2C8|nr:coiled-coil-helix-coiled-coil-helix domain-containing protein 2-like [Phodopus roborovskii]